MNYHSYRNGIPANNFLFSGGPLGQITPSKEGSGRVRVARLDRVAGVARVARVAKVAGVARISCEP